MLKLTKGAISFLTAQYRAIYKRAYLKGLASVFALTVGTVPAVALASDITNNDYREVGDGQSLDASKIVNNGTLKIKGGASVKAVDVNKIWDDEKNTFTAGTTNYGTLIIDATSDNKATVTGSIDNTNTLITNGIADLNGSIRNTGKITLNAAGGNSTVTLNTILNKDDNGQRGSITVGPNVTLDAKKYINNFADLTIAKGGTLHSDTDDTYVTNKWSGVLNVEGTLDTRKLNNQGVLNIADGSTFKVGDFIFGKGGVVNTSADKFYVKADGIKQITVDGGDVLKEIDVADDGTVTVKNGSALNIVNKGTLNINGGSVGNVKSSNKLNIDVTESNAQIKSVTVENVHNNWEDWVGVGANKSLYIENNFETVNGGNFVTSAGGTATIGGNFIAKNGDTFADLEKSGKGSLTVVGKTLAKDVNITEGSATFKGGINGNFNLKNASTEATLYADVSGSIYTEGNTLLTLRSFAKDFTKEEFEKVWGNVKVDSNAKLSIKNRADLDKLTVNYQTIDVENGTISAQDIEVSSNGTLIIGNEANIALGQNGTLNVLGTIDNRKSGFSFDELKGNLISNANTTVNSVVSGKITGSAPVVANSVNVGSATLTVDDPRSVLDISNAVNTAKLVNEQADGSFNTTSSTSLSADAVDAPNTKELKHGNAWIAANVTNKGTIKIGDLTKVVGNKGLSAEERLKLNDLFQSQDSKGVLDIGNVQTVVADGEAVKGGLGFVEFKDGNNDTKLTIATDATLTLGSKDASKQLATKVNANVADVEFNTGSETLHVLGSGTLGDIGGKYANGNFEVDSTKTGNLEVENGTLNARNIAVEKLDLDGNINANQIIANDKATLKDYAKLNANAITVNALEENSKGITINANSGDITVKTGDVKVGENSTIIGHNLQSGANAGVSEVSLAQGTKVQLSGALLAKGVYATNTSIETNDLTTEQWFTVENNTSTVIHGKGSIGGDASVNGGSLDANTLELKGTTSITGGANVKVGTLLGDKQINIGGADGKVNEVAIRELATSGALVIDPDYGQKAQVVTVQTGVNGTRNIDAKVNVGQNSVFAFGSSDSKARSDLSKLGYTDDKGSLKEDGVGAVAYLNRTIGIENGNLVVDKSITSTSTPVTDAGTLKMASGSAVVLSSDAYEDAVAQDGVLISGVGTGASSAQIQSGSKIALTGRFDSRVLIKDVYFAKTTAGEGVDASNAQVTIDNKSNFYDITFDGKKFTGSVSKKLDFNLALASRPVVDYVKQAILTLRKGAGVGAEFMLTNNIEDYGLAINNVAHVAAYSGAFTAANLASDVLVDAVSNRVGGSHSQSQLHNQKDEGISVWLNPFFRNADTQKAQAQGQVYTLNSNLSGVTLGADTKLGNFRVGLATAIGAGDITPSGNAAPTSNDVKSFGLGVYGGASFGDFDVSADMNYTKVDNEIKLLTTTKGFERLTTDGEVKAFTLGVNGSYKLTLNNGSIIQPHLGLRYNSFKFDDLSLNSSLGVVSQSKTDKLSQFSLPVGISGTMLGKSGDWDVKTTADVGMTFNFGDKNIKSETALTGVNGSVHTDTDCFDNVVFNGGISFDATHENLNLGVATMFKAGSINKEFGINANARYTF